MSANAASFSPYITSPPAQYPTSNSPDILDTRIVEIRLTTGAPLYPAVSDPAMWVRRRPHYCTGFAESSLATNLVRTRGSRQRTHCLAGDCPAVQVTEGANAKKRGGKEVCL